MFRAFLSYFLPTDSGHFQPTDSDRFQPTDPDRLQPTDSDPPPPYRTNNFSTATSTDFGDPAELQSTDLQEDNAPVAPSLIREDTPRNRFNFHVQLRQRQQVYEWERGHVDPELYGESESQEAVARTWVINHWKDRKLWDPEWSEDGPAEQDTWKSYGVPACLLTMEIGWEIEHKMYVMRPIFIPEINGERTRGMGMPYSRWPSIYLVERAVQTLEEHWEEWGFSSANVEQPSVLFREDLSTLYSTLPEPAHKRLLSKVRNWGELFPPLRRIGPRLDLFGGVMSPERTRLADEAEGVTRTLLEPTPCENLLNRPPPPEIAVEANQAMETQAQCDRTLEPNRFGRPLLPRAEHEAEQRRQNYPVFNTTPIFGRATEAHQTMETQMQCDPTPEPNCFGRPILPRAEQEAGQRRKHYPVFTTIPAPGRATEADQTMETRTQRDATPEFAPFGGRLTEQEREEYRQRRDMARQLEALDRAVPSSERELEVDDAEEAARALHQRERRTGNRSQRQQPLATQGARINKRNRRGRILQ